MNQREGEWGELVTIAFIEVVLELHPMKPQRVKECTPGLHKKQDTHRGKDEDDATNNKGENIVKPTTNNCISESAKMFILMVRQTCVLTPMPLLVLYRRLHWTTQTPRGHVPPRDVPTTLQSLIHQCPKAQRTGDLGASD